MPLNISTYRHESWDADVFHLDFDQCLSGRTDRANFYAPQPYEPDPTDTEICKAVLTSLMSPEGGCLQVSIQNGYRLFIKRSQAVSINDIVDRVQAAAKRAGTTAVLVRR